LVDFVEVPITVSLLFIVCALLITIAASVLSKKKEA
jgi:hypothetical protein